MAGDDLYHFPTPSEAFGRANNNVKQRQNSSQLPLQQQVQQLQYQQQRPQQRNDYPPLHPNQNVQQHPRSSSANQYQQQQIPPQQQRVTPNYRQPQTVLQQNYQQHPSPSASRSSNRAISQGSNEPASLNSGYNGYAPSAYSQLPNPPRQASPPRPDPTQTLERQLRDLFDRVDRNRNGRLGEDELATALLNNDGTKFQPSTVRLMIRLFDTDDSSTIEFREFYHLWNYILHWRKTFNKFDINGNHRISFAEYQSALESFGYRLPTDIVLFIFQKFGDFNSNKPMSLGFDKFVESLVWLLRCTNVFKKFDTQGNGVATISFQDFVHEIISFI